MNNPVGTFKRWRVQIFVITWLGNAAFYFTRKAPWPNWGLPGCPACRKCSRAESADDGKTQRT